MGLKLSQVQDRQMSRALGRHNKLEGLTKEKLDELINYTVDEMLTQVDTDYPLVK